MDVDVAVVVQIACQHGGRVAVDLAGSGIVQVHEQVSGRAHPARVEQVVGIDGAVAIGLHRTGVLNCSREAHVQVATVTDGGVAGERDRGRIQFQVGTAANGDIAREAHGARGANHRVTRARGPDASGERSCGAGLKVATIGHVQEGAGRLVHVTADDGHADVPTVEVGQRLGIDGFEVAFDPIAILGVADGIGPRVVGRARIDIEVRGVLAVIDGAVTVRVGFAIIGSAVAIAVIRRAIGDVAGIQDVVAITVGTAIVQVTAVKDAVVIAVGSAAGNIAGIRDAVSVTVITLALIRHAVVVAVIAAAAVDVALVRDVVSVAVVAGAIEDVVDIGRAVVVAVGALVRDAVVVVILRITILDVTGIVDAVVIAVGTGLGQRDRDRVIDLPVGGAISLAALEQRFHGAGGSDIAENRELGHEDTGDRLGVAAIRRMERGVALLIAGNGEPGAIVRAQGAAIFKGGPVHADVIQVVHAEGETVRMKATDGDIGVPFEIRNEPEEGAVDRL